MSVRYVQEAGKQLDPVYKGAIADVSAQIPQVEALYSALMSGLENRASTGMQDILASADRRGVGRDRLGADVGAVLGGTLDLERARANAGMAGDIAGITGTLSDLRVGNVTGRQDLGDSFQDIGLAKAENQLKLTEAQKKYAMDILALNRAAELDKQRAAIAASSGGGGYGSGGVDTTSAGPNPPAEFLAYLESKGDMRQYSRGTMDKMVNQWFDAKGIKNNDDRQAYWDLRNQYYGINPKPGKG